MIWGNFVMILTGSLIWFKIYVPKAFVDVSFIVHRYEAVLAVLAILVWHFYAVHWKPGKFPMSLIWITGRISEEELIEEHPSEYVKLTGKEPPRHGGDVKYSRTGPLISLVLIIIAGVIIYAKTPRIKQAFQRNMAIPAYQPPRMFLNEDLTPSNCQNCHGSFPHTKNVRLRAFANLHASKLYCETCHLEPGNSSQAISYAWYNGDKLQEPEPDVMLSGLEALVSYVIEDGKKRPLFMEKDSLNPEWRISLSGRACQVCHFGEGKYVIDFRSLGYDEEQVYNLNNSKALGMLIKRKTFYFYAF